LFTDTPFSETQVDLGYQGWGIRSSYRSRLNVDGEAVFQPWNRDTYEPVREPVRISEIPTGTVTLADKNMARSDWAYIPHGTGLTPFVRG